MKFKKLLIKLSKKKANYSSINLSNESGPGIFIYSESNIRLQGPNFSLFFPHPLPPQPLRPYINCPLLPCNLRSLPHFTTPLLNFCQPHITIIIHTPIPVISSPIFLHFSHDSFESPHLTSIFSVPLNSFPFRFH